MRLHIAENVFNMLNEGQAEPISERYFGRNWLGKDSTYMGYVRSTNSDISADALLTLYGKVIKQRVDTEQDIVLNRDNDLIDVFQKRVEFFSRLESYISNAIYDEAAASQGIEF